MTFNELLLSGFKKDSSLVGHQFFASQKIRAFEYMGRLYQMLLMWVRQTLMERVLGNRDEGERAEIGTIRGKH